MKEWLLTLHRDSLFRNSFYLMLSTSILGVLGFFFWVLCSRLYTPHDIGLATSVISAATLMSGLSSLGLNNSLIRFLATSPRQNAHLSTSFSIISVSSIVGAIGFLIWAVLAKSPIIQSTPFIALSIFFVAYVVTLTFNTLLESAFIAYRATSYILAKNFLLSVLKLVLPLFVLSMGFIGVVASIFLATAAAVLLSFFWLIIKFRYRPSFLVDKAVVKETYKFAAGNYTGGLFGILPSTVIPIIVLSRLGAQEAAFFYMPLMIITFLNVIPSATAQSLFAESAHDESKLTAHLRSSVRHLFALLVPAVIGVLLLGPFVLNFFGKDYAAAGTPALYVLAIASLVGALNYFGDTLLNIKKRSRMYIAMNALNAIVIIVLAYVMAPYGLTAIALSSLISQIVTLAVYVTINWRLIHDQLLKQPVHS